MRPRSGAGIGSSPAKVPVENGAEGGISSVGNGNSGVNANQGVHSKVCLWYWIHGDGDRDFIETNTSCSEDVVSRSCRGHHNRAAQLVGNGGRCATVKSDQGIRIVEIYYAQGG